MSTGEDQAMDLRVDGGVEQEAVAEIVDAEAALEQFPGPDTPGSGGDLDELDDGSVAGVAAQRDEYLALAQRTQADFENYRKRVARDSAAAEQRGIGRLARELLPALDSLDRALQASDGGPEQLIEGLRLVQRDLQGALQRVGIESYGVPGERFDPEYHEAVAQQPRPGVAPGIITEVFQPGYRLAGGGVILRPARVLVAG